MDLSIDMRAMRRLGRVAICGALLFGLGACESLREQLGLAKQSPDAFAVVTRAPLILPPDYSLRPPVGGGRAPQDLRPLRDARAAITGRNGQPGPARTPSPGEQALLAKVGADGIDPAIRTQVDRESGLLSDADPSFVERLLFGGPPADAVVDAPAEAERLRQNAASGRPTTSGTTPTLTQE